ncbi:glycosyltransferase family 4 protein [Stappia indica]|uniref:glycosyltransferase family 4 protein n=1 Tax=Stappia indica TaxID=538381 RepID=UPI001D18547D|nr:glycosyltransferase family 4 protein [Stappia indica]MCC4246275.1 glycosyltransferase family 4 protein [Stappia indica]
MRIAFTAPMKPLDDPVPSGDRTMGRLIVQALETAGHDVTVATRFRSWKATGGIVAQQEVEQAALAEAERVLSSWEAAGYRPDIFLTYHLYHKAPDWIGPAIASRLGIPYVVIEASRAPKRKTGEWSYGFAAADAALSRADLVAAMHRADRECLTAVVPAERLAVLTPFLDADRFLQAPRIPRRDSEPVRLLAIGMMREGAKLASYRLLAEALDRLPASLRFTLTVVGDGPCRAEVEALLARHPVTFMGAVAGEEIPALCASHDLFVWPAIREAFGLVFLEAQAAGLAIVGGDTFGVPDIVAHGRTGLLSAEGDAEAFARSLEALVSAPLRAAEMGSAARAHIREHHTLASGASSLDALLEQALRNFALRATASQQ